MSVFAIVAIALSGISLIGVGYLIFAADSVRRFAALPADRPAVAPVTLLKPLHGLDAELRRNLDSCLEQSHPQFQVVFGVRRPDDPAINVVRDLIAARPDRDLALVVDERVYGTNYKVSNLINAMTVATHDLLVIADSDMRVRRDYLASVAAPLADPSVGLVTCLYTGLSSGGLWSDLGALYVNHGFLPSVVVGQRVGGAEGCFGATMALSRATLEEIGGFAALKDHLADDYALGEAVRKTGRRLVLSPHLVATVVDEASLAALFRHELRWARTIKLIAPGGYAASIVTQPVAIACLGWMIGGFALTGLAFLAIALAARVVTVRVTEHALGVSRAPAWMIPLRDALSFAVFVTSFLGNRIAWRDGRFTVAPDGRLIPDGETRA